MIYFLKYTFFLGVHLLRINPFAVAIFFFATVGCAPDIAIESTPLGQSPSKGLSVPYSLPRGLLSFTVEKGEKDEFAKITLNNTTLIPDHRARYTATIVTNEFSSDNFKIALEDGLLTTVDSNTTDATRQIVNELTAGVSAILRGEARPSVESGVGRTETFSRNFLVDPFDHKSNPFPEGAIRFRDLNGHHLTHSRNYAACPEGSVCFPLMTTVVATVSVSGGASAEFYAIVPDPRKVASVDVRRFACVNTVQSVKLKRGVLTNFDLQKASSVAGCLSVPLDVISAIIRAPVDAITGQTARINANKGLVEAQKNLLAQQEALIKAQASLLATQSAASEDDG